MKNALLKLLLVVLMTNTASAQEWMKNLEVAQALAKVQNKMVLMVWEETTSYQYPVIVKDDKGRTIIINNLFEDEDVSPLIWQHFVPVIVSEDRYADLYEKIKDKRSQKYIDKFNDDSIKIMDINGNILNVDYLTEDLQDITTIIQRYALNTTFIAQELQDYKQDKNFYSAYFLASKYLDLGMYVNKDVRENIVELSNIYLEEAKRLVAQEDQSEQKGSLQRCDLLELQEELLLKRPKKVIRQLKKLKEEEIVESNKPFIAFLYYTAYMSNDKPEDAEQWKSQISSVNLKKAQLIINLNK
ncbi:MAG: hypothetical protein CMC05_05220 [Flavobacteriaceae bacterium]|uniref:hypothetical protein n=1 Tax=Winogradskyella poriferorum TaxID=307627 RepID=UPI000C526F54|nr:hypothetical protein [Flavobacteriaceae bacterium]MBD10840.1 hypothetical protein [Flavobacteriaceae bacterium]|tara:strand:- start:2090 stop:2989 length:900 start_codon:yes stop_codon:yes gene_type:complete